MVEVLVRIVSIQEFGLGCEYIRERKKRGKASRKDLAQQQDGTGPAESVPPQSPSGYSSDGRSPTETSRRHSEFNGRSSMSELPPPPLPASRSASLGSSALHSNGLMNDGGANSRPGSLGNLHEISNSAPINHHHQQVPIPQESLAVGPYNAQHSRPGDSPIGLGLNGFPSMHEYDRPSLNGPISASGMNRQMLQHGGSGGPLSRGMGHNGNVHAYGDNPFPILSPPNNPGPGTSFRLGNTGESPLSGFLGNSPVGGSPGWLSLPSPSAALYPHHQYPSVSQSLRYPVLQPLLHHISAILPLSLACDLLDLYFTSSSSAHMHPLSPYLLGHVFRKRSVLHPTRPRPCSPALLASMLWVGAQTSEAAFLTSPPAARGRICQKLLELTVGFLKPLIHGPSSNQESPNYSTSANTVINGVALGGFGVALPSVAPGSHIHGAEGNYSPGATGALDDVGTYIHLATVVSASEYKAASLRWWNAAWSLARELKLGREMPPSPPAMRHGGEARDQHSSDVDAEGEADVDLTMGQSSQHTPNGRQSGLLNAPPSAPGSISEEEREERRRIWWLLYIVDRHLALCYNRPLFLLDVECDGLLQPIDDTIWQAGDGYAGDHHPRSSTPSSPAYRRRGPTFECTGHSIFGYFLPLMTILGEIVDLNHARNHPRFGVGFRSAGEWDDQASEIAQQLEAYGRSLRDFEARFTTNLTESIEHGNGIDNSHNDATTPSVRSSSTVGNRMTESVIQTKIVIAYGTHVMHVLHILLTGKWDPISLLDDNDLWISSQSFISATGHAVSAAEAINKILEQDPDLSFMPFFFGIYLLQGSFLLLLIADKLQGEASPSVVKACETIVRAHEACVVTLNTEYQRNFRKVMRSALAQVRGRVPEDFGEQQLRRREVLALYRWTGDGTGLAL
ncbi:MAG: hypothetical protein M1827_002346 [Pycnora praestabilis]|nr:MAG: hypothetical protein M1827_002346 [Pycnora praestabilis]